MPASIESSLDTAGLATEQRGLLDLIDKLQFCQLDNVKLPQIVVVGDQSAGKSSVLEALTGTPFPRDAGACTRFATEIRMRRSKEARLGVSIIPDKNRPFEEQNRLRQFGGDVHGDTSFESLMRNAVDQIAPKHVPGRFAARDVLVVEKTGPDMPLLTLVDLPGLVRVANRDQSEYDIQTIEALSDRYMKSSRTIILAVIGGNNDYVQAPILQKARRFDPKGSRTIGVLTKPDLTEQIGLEDKFIGLVSNQDSENNFKLGWYVLLNPGPPRTGEPWPSAEERRQREDEFFGRGKWSTLPPSMCGIGALRQKLSLQLQRHIGRHIKSLRRQIQQALERCERELKAMGTARDTVEEMRQEMGELFSASNHLVTPAVDGTYKNPPGERFFAKESDPRGTPSQKLRARVREESERFARGFRQNGRKLNFLSSPSVQSPTLPEAGTTSNAKRDFARQEVEPLLAQSRGNELPLDSNPRAPFILFQDYSANWPTLAQEYKDNLGVLCNEFLADVIDYVWPVRMRDPLRAQFLEPLMKKMMATADEELGKLQDDMELEIQPFDPEYENRLRQWRADATENGGTYTEAEEVLEKMLIYYELTARIFIRNVVTQVIERHLLLGMLRLFNPVQILGMPNEIIEAIAAENKQMRERRQLLKTQRTAIQEAKAICANLAMRSELRTLYDEDQDEDTPSEDEGNYRSAYSRQMPPPVAPRPESTRTRRHRRNSGSIDDVPPAPSAPAPPVPENRPPRPPREPIQQSQTPNLPPRNQPPVPGTPTVPAHDAYSSSPSGSHTSTGKYDDDIAAAQHQSLQEYYASAQAHQQQQQQAMQEYQQAARDREGDKKDRRYRLPRLGN
jgi:hypothetical protein